MLIAETEERIFGQILFDVVNNTNIRRSSPGSKARSIAEALSKKLGQMYKKFDTNIAISFLDGASGKYLDFLGDMMGVSRLGETPGVTTSTERNVRFYVDTGTFGSINGNSSITIPSGTVISTGADSTGIRYQVPYTVILPAGSSELFVGVESLRPGIRNNVGVNQLIYHNFTDYSQSAQKTLKVKNDADIQTAQDVESDVNFRFRIANQVLSSEKGNQTSIRLSALTIPGVSDVVIIPFSNGIGSYDILVKSTTPTTPDGLISTVREIVTNSTSLGIVPNVRKPKETGLSLTGTLTLRNKISTADQTSLINSVTLNVSEYINSLDIGEDFVVNEALQRALETSDIIKNVGETGQPFDSLFIYKQSKLEDNKVRKTLISDYSPDVDERIIVETSFAGASPILFRVANI